MKKIKFHPREALPNRTALERADSLYTELTGIERDELGQELAAFRAALETQESRFINDHRERLLSIVLMLQR